MVGEFALGLAITSPVMVFSMLQLRVVQATDARHDYSFADYLGLRLVTTILALAAIVGIVAGRVTPGTLPPSSLPWRFQRRRLHQRRDLRRAPAARADGPHCPIHDAQRVAFAGGSHGGSDPGGGVLAGVFAMAISRLAILAVFDSPNAARVLRRRVPQRRARGESASSPPVAKSCGSLPASRDYRCRLASRRC